MSVAADDVFTPLHEAAMRGERARVQALLADGLEVDARDAYGITPLHLAVSKGHRDVAELLLSKGADASS